MIDCYVEFILGKWRFDPEASGVSVGTPFQPEVRMSSSLHKTIINSLFFRGAAGEFNCFNPIFTF